GNIGGAISATLALNNVQPVNGGNYTVVVTNKLSAVTSSVAVLTVLVPPSITSQPQSRTNISGTTALFNVRASGTEPFRSRWHSNVASIRAAISTTLALNDVQLVDAGNYTVVVTNKPSAMTSSVAVLTVRVPPSITSQPQSRTNISG